MQDYPAKARYRGEVAANYDQQRRINRANARRWDSETEVLREVLSLVPPESSVLDIPCGTGRFFPLLYARSLRIVGADISDEMLRQIPAAYLEGDRRAHTVVADAEELQFPNDAFDYVLSMRFYNHLSAGARPKVLSELSRVCTKGVIIQVRFRGPFAFLGDALRAILSMTKQSAPRLGEAPSPHYGPRGNPRLSEFRKLAEQCGLRLSETRKVWWGPTLNPMKICVLTKTSGDARP